jgi:hypothetical protein
MRLDHLAGHHRKPESQGDVIGCETLRSRLCKRLDSVHPTKRPNGDTPEIRFDGLRYD